MAIPSRRKIHCMYVWIQPTADQKKKILECSKKQNFDLPYTDDLHSIYIVFMTIYIAFTLY